MLMDAYDWEIKNPELALLKKLTKQIEQLTKNVEKIDQRLIKLESFIFQLKEQYKEMDKTIFL